MKTRGDWRTPLLKPGQKIEFVLEDLELAFYKEQLDRITKRWNNGESLDKISRTEQRETDEVFLALFHQARKGKITRPFALRLEKE